MSIMYSFEDRLQQHSHKLRARNVAPALGMSREAPTHVIAMVKVGWMLGRGKEGGEDRRPENGPDLGPASAMMVRQVRKLPCMIRFAASPCILVRTTSNGCRVTLTTAPDTSPADILSLLARKAKAGRGSPDRGFLCRHQLLASSVTSSEIELCSITCLYRVHLLSGLNTSEPRCTMHGVSSQCLYAWQKGIVWHDVNELGDGA